MGIFHAACTTYSSRTSRTINNEIKSVRPICKDKKKPRVSQQRANEVEKLKLKS